MKNEATLMKQATTQKGRLRQQARAKLLAMFDTLSQQFPDMDAKEIAAIVRSEAKTLTPQERERQKRERQSARKWYQRSHPVVSEERKAQAALGLRLIDIGYKALAFKYHPDTKDGSHEAMTRLNRARDHLRTYA
jgi:hypothetical protein